MICAKNNETVSTFVEVMQKKLWPLFFPDMVYMEVQYEIIMSIYNKLTCKET